MYGYNNNQFASNNYYNNNFNNFNNNNNNNYNNNQNAPNWSKLNPNSWVFGPKGISNQSLDSVLPRFFNMKYNYTPNIYRYGILDNNYPIYTLNTKVKSNKKPNEISRDLLDCSGKELDGQDLIVMKVDKNVHFIYDLIMNDTRSPTFLSQVYSKGVLNLSNLQTRFPELLRYINTNDRNHHGIDFILFLMACYCVENKHNVQVINISNNNLTSVRAFKTLKLLFPSLATIVAEGNNLDGKNFEKIKQSGVVIQVSIGGYNKPLPDFSKCKKHNPYLADENEMSPPNLIQPEIEPIVPLEINPNDFPANPFLISFLQQAKTRLDSIESFFSPSSTMSVTTESGTQLMFYTQFNRNIIRGQNNFASGPENIKNLHILIFGTAWNFAVSRMQYHELMANLYVMVLHGSFLDRNQILIGFDLSLMIARNADTFWITNEQIHFRSLER
ncbi:hypothetical protein TRFO_40689 [Tritrichomonas foetus]|uniref:NTF2 domain-containing protein n=1 Tax=Tritrichomonas foetus TaxID=1144522 RepID=A0A1J4J6F6_9EUKA|nr:hypothetical protein TRFO_40689 [Tritrichomonas foetus]|eukprot:OHS93013.1 hypothetical protein TRFO_40689 [Tritrichomonas foetus]